MAGRSKSSAQSLVEGRWKPVFDLVEKSRLRRGKALAKQGGVKRLVARDGVVTTSVRGGGLNDSFQVRFPTVDWLAPHLDAVAVWFARRPDWQAGLLAGEWDRELVAFLDENQVHLFPDEAIAKRIVGEMECGCFDVQAPCIHGVAAVCRMEFDMEADPLLVFSYAGIDADLLLDRIHEKAFELVSAQGASMHPEADMRADADQDWNSDGKVSLWPEERTAFESGHAHTSAHTSGINHVITPKLQITKPR